MNTELLSHITQELGTVFEPPAAEKLAQVMVSVYEQLHESMVLQRLDALENAMRRSHEELARRVEEQLAAHRQETDERFRDLREAQHQMYTEFQEFRKETDRRFLELREEFQEFRKETDRRFLELREEFQEFRKETDRRFLELREEFQEFRKETDRRFRELAETVRLTQEALRDLALTVKDLQKQVGGLSQTVGYVLENEAMKALPELLRRDHGLQVVGRLKRQYVQDSAGRYIEVNIFGTATRDGEQVTLVGESKSQLSKNDVDRFLRRTVDALREVYPNILPIIVTHITSEPDAEAYARSLGVVVYYSYEF
ncbi:MAG: hypothetical protein KatS3mg023_0939 [Armatimonadota bacterium]|nr:MAG: hypothetical protein KatS3mg023_0939 [Armatimonadota bacterium]